MHINSKPIIIFVHGLGLSGEVWTPQRDWCKKNNVNFVVLTLLGHGKRRNEKASIEKMVYEIEITAKKFPKVILVGHSFGAFLCSLVAPRLDNIKSILFINPMFSTDQLPMIFLPSIRTVKILQRIFGLGKVGDFSEGTKLFWHWGIYFYLLGHNSAKTLEDIFYQIKKREKKPFPRNNSCTKIILSKQDELVKPTKDKDSIVVPTSGHMLFRLNPEVINCFLDQLVSRQAEHRL